MVFFVLIFHQLHTKKTHLALLNWILKPLFLNPASCTAPQQYLCITKSKNTLIFMSCFVLLSLLLLPASLIPLYSSSCPHPRNSKLPNIYCNITAAQLSTQRSGNGKVKVKKTLNLIPRARVLFKNVRSHDCRNIIILYQGFPNCGVPLVICKPLKSGTRAALCQEHGGGSS